MATKFSRRHYVAIAEIIARVHSLEWVAVNEQASTGIDAVEEIADGLARIFVKDNGRFDHNRFRLACKAK